LAKKAAEITASVNELTTTKQKKIKDIMEIKANGQKIKAETKKIQEELVQFVQYKKFLDELAEQSGLLKRQQEENNRKEDDGDTFLTQN